jgi:hypothetical protein
MGGGKDKRILKSCACVPRTPAVCVNYVKNAHVMISKKLRQCDIDFEMVDGQII